MTGRVLSEVEWLTVEDQFNSDCDEIRARSTANIPDLIATIRDRDRTIGMLRKIDNGMRQYCKSTEKTIADRDDTIYRLQAEIDARKATDGLSVIEEQNAIMREALERRAENCQNCHGATLEIMRNSSSFIAYCYQCKDIVDALAKVKGDE